MLTPRRCKILHAIKVGSRLVTLRLLRLDALIERLPLQDELLVRNDGDLLAGGDDVAFANLERDDRAADARAGDELVHRLNRGDDSLSVLDFPRGYDDLRGLGQPEASRGKTATDRSSAFPAPRQLLTYILSITKLAIMNLNELTQRCGQS